MCDHRRGHHLRNGAPSLAKLASKLAVHGCDTATVHYSRDKHSAYGKVTLMGAAVSALAYRADLKGSLGHSGPFRQRIRSRGLVYRDEQTLEVKSQAGRLEWPIMGRAGPTAEIGQSRQHAAMGRSPDPCHRMPNVCMIFEVTEGGMAESLGKLNVFKIGAAQDPGPVVAWCDEQGVEFTYSMGRANPEDETTDFALFILSDEDDANKFRTTWC